MYGNFAWTGFDYRGETSLGWPDVSSAYGIFDLAGFPKDGVGYYNAWWRDGPDCSSDAVSLAVSPGDWTAPVPVGSPIDVVVTTCAAMAQLFVNGVTQGTVPVERFGFAMWPAVPFHPGNLTAVALDRHGVVLKTVTILAAGPARRLEAWVESPYPATARNSSVIAADGQDAALIGVRLVDAAGTVVPNADVNVTFAVAGPAAVIGVGNGDPADHSPDKAPWRRTFHGLARCIVASAHPGDAGAVTVTATTTATGVASATVELLAAK